MKAYITLSHKTSLIKLQIHLIRKYIKEVDEIIVVVGPFGANPITSAGERVISEEDLIKIDAKTRVLYAPNLFAGLMPGSRFKAILSWVFEKYIAFEEQPVIYLQSDCLPTKEIKAEEILQGKGIAGRMIKRTDVSGGEYAYPTWMIIDPSKEPDFVDLDFSRIADLHIQDGYWCGVEYQSYTTIRMKGEDVVDKLGNLFGYEDFIGFEWCEPSFLHIDKISSNNDAYWSKKEGVICSIFDIDKTWLEEIVPKSHKVQSHPPKVLPKDKFNPEINVNSKQFKQESKRRMSRPKRKGVPNRGPSLFKIATNFTKAAIKHVVDKGKNVTEEEYKKRLEVCSGNEKTPPCEFYEKGRCLHASCGCFLSKKAWWASEDCPEGKWPKIQPQESSQKDEPKT